MSFDSSEQAFTEQVSDHREGDSSIDFSSSQATASSICESTEAEESDGNSGGNNPVSPPSNPEAQPDLEESQPSLEARLEPLPQSSAAQPKRKVKPGRPTSGSSYSMPQSTHATSEFSTSTDETQDKKGSYKLSTEEKHGRKRQTLEPDLKAAAVSILPPPLRYNWAIDSTQKDEIIKIGSLKYKGRKLRMEARLMPGICRSNSIRMAKLLVIIQLGNAKPELHKYKVYVHTTMYDNEVDRVIDEYKRNYRFPENKSSIKLIINLCKQELIEKSKQKNLEILVEVKVYGSLRKFSLSETDGFLNVTET